MACLLQVKADLLIGVGEEVVITRPTIFGPKPREIYDGWTLPPMDTCFSSRYVTGRFWSIIA